MSSVTASTPAQRHVRIRLVPYTPPFALQGTAQHHTSSPSLRFAPVDRLLPANVVVKIGRFTDRHAQRPTTRPPLQDDIRFRSKVVSRHHAEMWVGEDNNLYLRDTASSSGTFLNQVRLSAQNVPSATVRLRDGDCIQLGVEYRGGEEEVYRCVRMRVEVDRPQDQSRQYRAAVLNAITGASPSPSPMANQSSVTANATPAPNLAVSGNAAFAPQVAADTCCICLMSLRRTPLFVTSCLHCFHYACAKPMLRVMVRTGGGGASNPGGGRIVEEEADGFNCPICRTYVDLNAEPVDDDDDDLLIAGAHDPNRQLELDRSKLEQVMNRQMETINEVQRQQQINESNAGVPELVRTGANDGAQEFSNLPIAVIETVAVPPESSSSAVGTSAVAALIGPPTSNRTVNGQHAQTASHAQESLLVEEHMLPMSGNEDEQYEEDDAYEEEDDEFVDVDEGSSPQQPEHPHHRGSDDESKDDDVEPDMTMRDSRQIQQSVPTQTSTSPSRRRGQRTSRWWFGGSTNNNSVNTGQSRSER